MSPALASNALEVVASVAGRGLAVVPELAVAGLLRDGRLHRVLPDLVGTELTFALVYPERRLLEPQDARSSTSRSRTSRRGRGSSTARSARGERAAGPARDIH